MDANNYQPTIIKGLKFNATPPPGCNMQVICKKGKFTVRDMERVCMIVQKKGVRANLN